MIFCWNCTESEELSLHTAVCFVHINNNKKQIQKPLNCNQRNITLRTLRKLKFDNRIYRRAKKKIAKLYNNVIRRPMVKFELSQVAPPYLHILLGIVKKHHTLLETASDSIDQKIAQTLINQKRTIEEDTLAFNSFVEKRVEQLSWKKRVDTLRRNCHGTKSMTTSP